MPRHLFVTRHPGALDWAERHGVQAARVESNLDVATVEPGDVVIGTLPVHLIAELNRRGAHYWHLTMNVPAEWRGRELSADDMEACSARLDEFRVVGTGTRSAAMTAGGVAPPGDDGPTLHLCIASGQTQPNVLPMLMERWERVVIFASPKMLPEAERLKPMVEVLAQQSGHDGAPIVVDLPGDADYPALKLAVERAVASLRCRFPAHRLVLNVTGGTKLMTLAFTDALRSQARIVYCDTERGVLETIDSPGTVHAPLQARLIDLDALLAVQGYKITRVTRADSHAFGAMKQREALTARLALRLPTTGTGLQTRRDGDTSWTSYGLGATLHALANAAVASARSERQGFQPEQETQLLRGGFLDGPSRELLNQLMDLGLLRDPGPTADGRLRLVFADLDAADYLAGGYMEEFALLSVAAVGLPAAHFGANVGLDRLGRREGRKHGEMNELDVALVWRNKLLTLETKAGRALVREAQGTLNKSASLKLSVGGLLATSWIVTNAREADIPSDVFDRANLNSLTRVEIVSGFEQLRRLPERIAQWAGVSLPSGYRRWDEILEDAR